MKIPNFGHATHAAHTVLQVDSSCITYPGTSITSGPGAQLCISQKWIPLPHLIRIAFLSSLPVDGIQLPVTKASKSRIKFVQTDTSAIIFFNPRFETLPVDRTDLYSQLAREAIRLNSLFALITVTTLHSLDPPLDTTQKAWCFNHFGNTRTLVLDGYLKAKVHTLLV